MAPSRGESCARMFDMPFRIADGKELRIAISGKSGCGNTTVSTLLAETLGVRLINYTFRQVAAERKLTLAEVMELAMRDDSVDKYVDEKQIALAREESCVVGSRLAIWLLEEADFKVYLLAAPDVRARRIFQREGGSLEEIRSFTAMRDREDTERYKRIYNIDNNNWAFADLEIDTTHNTPDMVISLILRGLEKRGLITKD